MKQTNLVDLSSNLYDALNQLPPNSIALDKTMLPYFLYKKGKKTPRLLHKVLNGRECVDQDSSNSLAVIVSPIFARNANTFINRRHK